MAKRTIINEAFRANAKLAVVADLDAFATEIVEQFQAVGNNTYGAYWSYNSENDIRQVHVWTKFNEQYKRRRNKFDAVDIELDRECVTITIKLIAVTKLQYLDNMFDNIVNLIEDAIRRIRQAPKPIVA